MTNVMNPSDTTPMTSAQIGEASDLLTVGLRKAGLSGAAFQRVIESQSAELTAEMVAAVRNRVDAQSNLIVRRVTVKRDETGQQVLDATGRKQYTDRKVVDAMPKGDGAEAEVVFFKLDRYISDDDLEKEYELRGLKAADPYSQAAVNKADPAFADKYPNGTHWKDARGKWCFATFRQWFGGERRVYVRRSDDGWYGYWWFAGVRK